MKPQRLRKIPSSDAPLIAPVHDATGMTPGAVRIWIRRINQVYFWLLLLDIGFVIPVLLAKLTHPPGLHFYLGRLSTHLVIGALLALFWSVTYLAGFYGENRKVDFVAGYAAAVGVFLLAIVVGLPAPVNLLCFPGN